MPVLNMVPNKVCPIGRTFTYQQRYAMEQNSSFLSFSGWKGYKEILQIMKLSHITELLLNNVIIKLIPSYLLAV